MATQLTNLWNAFAALGPEARVVVLTALLLVILLLAWTLVVLVEAIRLRWTSRRGRHMRAPAIPPTNFARDGKPSDPLNLRVVGDADQLSAAFVSAGWYRADELRLITSIRISIDALLARKYSSAPVSDLYLFGRKQDFAFEKPGRSVRQRDHVRFWKAPYPADDGRPLWIGGATRDSKVELSKTNHLPTHGIAPDVDAERDLIVDDLLSTGWVVGLTLVPNFPGPTQAQNATGDPYHTDGRAALLTLARVEPTPMLPQLVRQPIAPLARQVARRLRGRLPQAGRDLAQRVGAQRKSRSRPTEQ